MDGVSKLAWYLSMVIKFCIKADLVFKHDKRVRVRNDYP